MESYCVEARSGRTGELIKRTWCRASTAENAIKVAQAVWGKFGRAMWKARKYCPEHDWAFGDFIQPRKANTHGQL